MANRCSIPCIGPRRLFPVAGRLLHRVRPLLPFCGFAIINCNRPMGKTLRESCAWICLFAIYAICDYCASCILTIKYCAHPRIERTDGSAAWCPCRVETAFLGRGDSALEVLCGPVSRLPGGERREPERKIARLGAAEIPVAEKAEAARSVSGAVVPAETPR